jgi:hypothetical protein
MANDEPMSKRKRALKVSRSRDFDGEARNDWVSDKFIGFVIYY